MKRNGAVAVEMAVIASVMIPVCLILADFAIYSACQAQSASAVQTMASQAQAAYFNGTDTTFDASILANGASLINVGNPSVVTQVARNPDPSTGTTAITWTITASNWQPSFTGIFPKVVTKVQTVYKR